ncbi:hypothetical protein [Streptomyces chartreusis]|uniref:hypothetical protein n=1 Tax=Streptomyces chartreusis TaxID=1969 RepID=UPI0035DFB4FB
MTTSQQDRLSTPEEDIKELYNRFAKLNDIVSALLAPTWGSKTGIIPADHPLYSETREPLPNKVSRLLDCGHCYEENGEECHPHPECPLGTNMPDVAEPRDLSAAVAELAQALRLTREYVGEELLPAVEGWSWYDALRRHAPHELAVEESPEPAARQPAYDAVYAYIRALGDDMPTSKVNRNAMIWHAVNDALEAMPRTDGRGDTALDTPAENSGPTIPNHQVNEGEPADNEPDICRPVEVDGEMIRVRGAGDFSEESQAALTEVVRAARRRMINEQRAAMAKYPYEDGDVTVLGPETFVDATGKVISWRGANFVPQNRLRLAHEARRRKEGMLDGIRRALCDVGLMEDDDPYGHADLEDVIRQNGRALAEAGDDPAATEATEPYPPIGHTGDQP